MTAPGDYQVKVEGPGINLTRTVAATVATQVIAFLLSGGELKAGETQQTGGDGQAGLAGSGGLRALLKEHQAKRIQEKIVTVGAFLMDTKRVAAFSKPDLIREFEAVHESVPKNLPRDIKVALRTGWIAEKTGQADAYYVTTGGRTALNAKFVEGKKKAKRTGNRAKKKRAEAK